MDEAVPYGGFSVANHSGKGSDDQAAVNQTANGAEVVQQSSDERPLDRMRRPAPHQQVSPDMSQLIHDLNTGLELPEIAEPSANPPVEQPAAAPPVTEPDPRPLLISPAAQPAPPVKTFRHRKRLGRWLAAALLGICLGFGAAWWVATAHDHAVQASDSQADQQWNQAVAQWQCTLHQYQVQQANDNHKAKEPSCEKR